MCDIIPFKCPLERDFEIIFRQLSRFDDDLGQAAKCIWHDLRHAPMHKKRAELDEVFRTLISYDESQLTPEFKEFCKTYKYKKETVDAAI